MKTNATNQRFIRIYSENVTCIAAGHAFFRLHAAVSSHHSPGAYWFWDTLVDADLANNTLGWQSTAGCGADAAPYFRIFNPILQSERFDANGEYIRKWVPELRRLKPAWIHKPWQAPQAALADAGIRLGLSYPFPVVTHEDARREALEAYDQIRPFQSGP